MSIVIDDPDLERHLRALAAERGESVEDVVRRFVRPSQTGSANAERHGGSNGESEQARQERLAEARRIIDRIHSEIVRDPRSPDEIIGYDEDGLPR